MLNYEIHKISAPQIINTFLNSRILAHHEEVEKFQPYFFSIVEYLLFKPIERIKLKGVRFHIINLIIL